MIKLYGKPIRVNKASAHQKNLDVGANIFIGNLDPEVDEKLLYDTFSAFGVILQTPKIMRDPETGNSKGYAFVNFASFEASDAAIEAMNGQYLCNRPITISYAFKKDAKGERHGSAAERLLAAQNPLAQADRPHQLFADAPPTAPGMVTQQTTAPTINPSLHNPMMAHHVPPPPPPPAALTHPSLFGFGNPHALNPSGGALGFPHHMTHPHAHQGWPAPHDVMGSSNAGIPGMQGWPGVPVPPPPTGMGFPSGLFVPPPPPPLPVSNIIILLILLSLFHSLIPCVIFIFLCFSSSCLMSSFGGMWCIYKSPQRLYLFVVQEYHSLIHSFPVGMSLDHNLICLFCLF